MAGKNLNARVNLTPGNLGAVGNALSGLGGNLGKGLLGSLQGALGGLGKTLQGALGSVGGGLTGELQGALSGVNLGKVAGQVQNTLQGPANVVAPPIASGANNAAGTAAAGGGSLGIDGGAASIAGPLGIALAVASAVKEKIDKGVHDLNAAPFEGIGKGLGLVDHGLKSLNSSLGPLSLAFDALDASTEGLHKFAGAVKDVPVLGPWASGLADGLTAAVAPMRSLTESMISLGKQANQAAGLLYDRAVADTAATVGRVFVPVLRLATDAIRLFGDVAASILPSGQEVSQAFEPLKDILGDVKDAATALAPIFRDVLAAELRSLGKVLRFVADQIHNSPLLSSLRLLGTLTGGQSLTSSVGAASTTAKFSGIEEFSKQNQLRAFGGGAESAPIQTRDYVAKIYELLRERLKAPTEAAGRGISGVAGRDPATIRHALTGAVGNAIFQWAGR